MPLSADAFADSMVMELAMRSARSGSVAASAFAMPLSADAFADDACADAFADACADARADGAWKLGADAVQDLKMMRLAMCSARSGSVVASASATPLSAHTFQEDLSVRELTMRSARSGSVRPALPRRCAVPLPSRTHR
jgi:hypothetical protein